MKDSTRTVRIMELDIPNKNGITYTTEAVERAIEDWNQVFGTPMVNTFDPKPKPHVDVNSISHVVSDLRISDGYLVGEVKVLNTPNGITLAEIVEDIDFAPRGWGVISKEGVVTDYKMIAIDAVSNLHKGDEDGRE